MGVSVDKEDILDSRANLHKLVHWEVDIRGKLAKQDLWEVDIRANLVKLELTRVNLLRGCLVCSTQQILIPLGLQLVKVAINNSIPVNHPILLPVQHSHPQHLPSTLL